MTTHDDALYEVVVRAFKDAFAELEKQARKVTRAGLAAVAKDTGNRKITVEVDGVAVASATLTDPEVAARVADEAAVVAWVRQAYPERVTRRLVTEVEPEFLAELLAEMTTSGVPQHVDADGVVHDVPGVRIAADRAVTHQVRFRPGGRDAVLRAVQEQRIALPAEPLRLALGAGEEKAS